MSKLTSSFVGRGRTVRKPAVNVEEIFFQFLQKARYALELAEKGTPVSLITKGYLRDELRGMKKKFPAQRKVAMLRFFDPDKFDWNKIQVKSDVITAV